MKAFGTADRDEETQTDVGVGEPVVIERPRVGSLGSTSSIADRPTPCADRR